MWPILLQIPSKLFTVDQVLSNYAYVFYASFLVTFVFTPIMRAAAIYHNIIDRPDKIRKMHDTPVAYLGGVAVFLGWLTGLTVSQYLVLHRVDPGWPTEHPMVHVSIVMGALIIVVLGLWDDVLRLSPKIKIFGQVLAALCLVFEGIGVRAANMVIGPLVGRIVFAAGGDPLHTMLPQWLTIGLGALFVIAVVVGCCNASNLLDGLDGLCGGVTAIIATGFLFLAVHLAMVGGGVETNWDALRVILALALLGAVLGFVPYNFNPASIFMGDTGSMFLGFACATMIILMAQDGAKWFLACMVIFALPILDTSLAFMRRWINGRPLFSADKQHFHHQLVGRGLSVKQTVLVSYGLAIFFGLLGVGMVFLRTRYVVGIYLVVFGSIIVAAYKMGMVHEKSAFDRITLGPSASTGFMQPIESARVLNIEAPASMGMGLAAPSTDADDASAHSGVSSTTRGELERSKASPAA